MKRTVFYSWQSDSDAALNRSLIETALERALKAIGRDETSTIEPVLDRDTSGVGGSPAITDTIFQKIAGADVFVADVTIINAGAGGRLCPNPNVILELGYAIAQLGWDRILLVQNTSFGAPELLPFDLRGRRVIAYAAGGKDDRAEARGLLQGRLELALRGALREQRATQTLAGPNVPLWWGHWTQPDRHATHGGTLFVREVGPAGFLFELDVWNGSHTGQVSGFARLSSPHLACARLPGSEPDKFCELTFRRSFTDRHREIDIEEAGDGFFYHGMGATFTGRYVWKYLALFEGGRLDEIDLQRLHNITGQYFEPMMDRFQGLSDPDIKDVFQVRGVVGGVRGLYTIMEAIVLRGARGQLWAAYIDDDVVRYFTTEREYMSTLPKTIEEWRSRFADKAVVYDSPVDRIAPDRV
jgi:hypothetical protein